MKKEYCVLAVFIIMCSGVCGCFGKDTSNEVKNTTVAVTTEVETAEAVRESVLESSEETIDGVVYVTEKYSKWETTYPLFNYEDFKEEKIQTFTMAGGDSVHSYNSSKNADELQDSIFCVNNRQMPDALDKDNVLKIKCMLYNVPGTLGNKAIGDNSKSKSQIKSIIRSTPLEIEGGDLSKVYMSFFTSYIGSETKNECKDIIDKSVIEIQVYYNDGTDEFIYLKVKQKNYIKESSPYYLELYRLYKE